MTIEKKLDALIDALGFDVERVETGIVHCDCHNSNPLARYHMAGCMKCQGTGVLHGVFDYKLTKRPNPLDVLYDDISLRQLTQNVIDLEVDPTLSASDKWIKYPKEQFFAVIDWFGNDAKRMNEHRYNVFSVGVSLDEEQGANNENN